MAFDYSASMSVSCNGVQIRVSSYFQIKQFTCTVQGHAETPAWVLRVVKHEKLQCICSAQNIFSLPGLLLRLEMISLRNSSVLYLLSLEAPVDQTGRCQSHAGFCRAAAVAVSAVLLVWTQHHTPAVLIFPVLAHLHVQSYLWLVLLWAG